MLSNVGPHGGKKGIRGELITNGFKSLRQQGRIWRTPLRGIGDDTEKLSMPVSALSSNRDHIKMSKGQLNIKIDSKDRNAKQGKLQTQNVITSNVASLG